jgi:hypothetical protein
MQDDVGKIIYGVLIGFIVIILIWIGYLFIVGCGFSLDCDSYYSPAEHTPIPTLIPAKIPIQSEGESKIEITKCQVSAEALMGSWVSAGYPESETFPFNDVNGTPCIGIFAQDVLPLFVEANLWFNGALACSTCHNANISAASAQLDTSSYAGILAGTKRASESVTGDDILGGGDWEASMLYDDLFVSRTMPFGLPADAPAEGPTLFAGSPE